MFAKLITSRFLHIRASPEQASMEFYGGKSPKIASVHQFGLSEENRKDGKKIDYPARPLLGFTGEDVQMIEEIIWLTLSVSFIQAEADAQLSIERGRAGRSIFRGL